MTTSREIILVRHGYSGGRGESYGQYGPEGGPLYARGWREAEAVGLQLVEWGFEPRTETVAVSPMLRTQQTAEGAGCLLQRTDPLLAEVSPSLGMDEYDQIVRNRIVPERVNEMVAALLAKPPKERVWFMHGVPMGWLLEVCGFGEPDSLVPPCGAVRKACI